MGLAVQQLIHVPVSQADKPATQVQAYHATAAKMAIVCGAFFTTVSIVGLLSLVGVVSFGIIPFAALITITAVGGIGSTLCFLKAYWASRKKEDLSFEQYVVTKCSGFTLKQATDLACLGKEVVQKISSDQMFTNHDALSEQDKEFCKRALALLPKDSEKKQRLEKAIEKEQLTDEEFNLLKKLLLVPVSWHFIKCVFDTDQGYERGMIKFKDPQHKIAAFFEPAMRHRASTHFRAERNNSLGCDILQGLPYDFEHVLMGTLKQAQDQASVDFSFCKLEEYGLERYKEMIKHGYGVIRMVVTKALGEADGPNERKEKRIPKKIKKAFQLLCSQLLSAPETKPKTIAAMVRWAKTKQQIHSQEVGAFMQALDDYYPKAAHIYHQYRTGNEAIIDPIS